MLKFFQISPENLTVGAVSRPQFMNRIETLKEHPSKAPKIILVINPMDALVSKDNRRPDTVMLEELTRQLIQSNIPILATMSPGSHLLLDSKPEWEGIFEVFRVPEPPTDRLIGVLKAQVPNFQKALRGYRFSREWSRSGHRLCQTNLSLHSVNLDGPFSSWMNCVFEHKRQIQSSQNSLDKVSNKF